MAATLIAGLLLPAHAHAQTQSDVSPPRPNYGAQAFDLVLIRPLGLAATAVGAVLFLPAAFLSSPGGMDAIEEAAELFVVVPGEYAITRPLGEF